MRQKRGKGDGRGAIVPDENIEAAFRALYLIQEKGDSSDVKVKKYEKQLSDWSTAQLRKNTKEEFERLLEDNKKRAEKAKNAAAIAKAEADRKAFEAEEQAKQNSALAAVKAAEESARKAKLEENAKASKIAEEQKQQIILTAVTEELKRRAKLTEDLIGAYKKLVSPEDLKKLNTALEDVDKTLNQKHKEN